MRLATFSTANVQHPLVISRFALMIRAWAPAMPWKQRKPCAWPQCPTLVSGRFCATHTREADAQRPNASARGYGAEHRAMRTRVIAEEPICRICGEAPSKHADHITPLRRGGTNARSNYQGTCHSCHSRKTATHDGGFGHTRAP